jgi:hypothetical protein
MPFGVQMLKTRTSAWKASAYPNFIRIHSCPAPNVRCNQDLRHGSTAQLGGIARVNATSQEAIASLEPTVPQAAQIKDIGGQGLECTQTEMGTIVRVGKTWRAHAVESATASIQQAPTTKGKTLSTIPSKPRGKDIRRARKLAEYMFRKIQRDEKNAWSKEPKSTSLENWLAQSATLERGCGKRAISSLLNKLQHVNPADVAGASRLVQATVARLLSAARTGTDHLRLLRAFAPAVVRLPGLQGLWLDELERAVCKGMTAAAGDKAVVQRCGPWLQLLSLQAALRRPCDASWKRVEQYKKIKGVLQHPRETEIAIAAAGKLSMALPDFPTHQAAVALHAACRQHRQQMKPAAVRRTLRWLAEFWPEEADKSEMQVWVDAAVDRMHGTWSPHDVRFLLKAYQVAGLTVSDARSATLLAAAVDNLECMHVEMLVDIVHALAMLGQRPHGAAANALLRTLRRQVPGLGPRHASTVLHALGAMHMRLEAAATAMLFRSAVRHTSNSNSTTAIGRLLSTCASVHVPNAVVLPRPVLQTLRSAAPSMTAREVFAILEPLRRLRLRLGKDVESLLLDAVKRTLLQMPDWNLTCVMRALGTLSTPMDASLRDLLLEEWRRRTPKLSSDQGHTYAALLAALADLELLGADARLPPLLLRAALRLLPAMQPLHASQALLVLCTVPQLRGHRRLWSSGVAALHGTLQKLDVHDVVPVLHAMSALSVGPQDVSDRFLTSLNSMLQQTLPRMDAHEATTALKALASIGMRAEHLTSRVVHEAALVVEHRLSEMNEGEVCSVIALVAVLGICRGESMHRALMQRLVDIKSDLQRMRPGSDNLLCDMLWGVAVLGLPVDGSLREQLAAAAAAVEGVPWQQAARLEWAAQQLRLRG